MIVLHGIWHSTELHLWGENSTPAAPRRKKASAPRKQPPPEHPFALSPTQIRQAIRGLAGYLPDCRTDEVSGMLPSDSRGPVPSRLELLRQGEAPKRGSRKLIRWMLPSLALSPVPALRLLAALPATAPPGLFMGASLLYWSEAAKLCLELLAQGAFLPDVEKEADGRLRAKWSPVLEGDGVAERLRLLASAMPPVCRALDTSEAGASALLNSFLTAVTDAWVRHTGKGLSPTSSRSRPKSPAEAWLASLFAEEPHFAAPPGKAAHFLKEMRQ